MEAINITSFEQVPAGLNYLIQRLNQLEAIINSKANQSTAATPAADELLTRKQTAIALKVSLPTLNELTKAGTLKGYRVTGSNRLRYKSSEVNNALTVIKPANLAA